MILNSSLLIIFKQFAFCLIIHQKWFKKKFNKKLNYVMNAAITCETPHKKIIFITLLSATWGLSFCLKR